MPVLLICKDHPTAADFNGALARLTVLVVGVISILHLCIVFDVGERSLLRNFSNFGNLISWRPSEVFIPIFFSRLSTAWNMFPKSSPSRSFNVTSKVRFCPACARNKTIRLPHSPSERTSIPLAGPKPWIVESAMSNDWFEKRGRNSCLGTNHD